MRISEAIKQFRRWRNLEIKASSVKGDNGYLNQFCLYLHDCDVNEIKLDDILGHIELLKTLEYKPNSFPTRENAIKKFLEFLKRQGYQVIDPMLVPVEDGDYSDPYVANDEDMEKFLKIIPNNNDPRHIRNKAIFLIMENCGIRNSECCSINLDQINLEKQTAVIKSAKVKQKNKRKFRLIKWSSEANEALKKWLEKRQKLVLGFFSPDQNACFLSVTGAKAGQRLTNKGVDEFFRRYSHEAGLSQVLNPHSLRHRFVQKRLEEGIPMHIVKDLVGHASILSLQAYTKLTVEKEMASWDKLYPQ